MFFSMMMTNCDDKISFINVLIILNLDNYFDLSIIIKYILYWIIYPLIFAKRYYLIQTQFIIEVKNLFLVAFHSRISIHDILLGSFYYC